ncbi:glycoside hydrolase family 2 [Mycolicibacterium mucogenicum]|uniref:Glycoside hydrolase family 2 n=1 Tax=Mycolicibacterium mucogenicum TaxID=56689 RepID=A0A1A0N5R2_MYCMU|nr:glycoside hydrolase family 2 TIM barrel-domain containing protein [Mycolicibacterium mucogenicum]OBA93020.1 glycoside hydrolase family 2 [Mycolicibacterium mucogenicum]
MSTTRIQPLEVWSFRRDDAAKATTVRLPHDAMIGERRGPSSPGGADVGWFFGGRYEYRTIWRPLAQDRGQLVSLRFDGVQGDSAVYVNEELVGQIRGGYTECELMVQHAIAWGVDNEICVEVDNRDQPNSRWYSGSGLYRPVQVIVRPPVHFAADGLRVRTEETVGDRARIEVTYEVIDPAGQAHKTAVEIWDGDTLVAAGVGDTAAGMVTLDVADARLWSADDPHLYRLVARIESDETILDERSERVGLRTIEVDARNGLRVNGQTVLLRGACVHHDNGILGAATHRTAEFRRVRILKEAGFNAILSAHNPMSRHMLDACDELGMYVVDEFADYWYVHKTAHDHADRFRDTWRDDAAKLIEKDRNRPSVVMYAIGNEIPETATADGVELAREISAYFRAADPGRPVTVAVNIFLNVLVSLGISPYKKNQGATSMAGSTEANVMVNQIGRMMNLVTRLPRADRATRNVFGVVDVAGYNYGLARYRRDVKAYPGRVILGTETLPGDVARAWDAVRNHPAVIGDFVWAGWEYLGEAGVGVWVPGKRAGLSKPYPYLVAGPALIDLTGHPDTSLRLAQAAWGTLAAPAIAVRPVDRSGQPVVRSAWRSTDAVQSWSWRGCQGRLAEIEVYSGDDEIELLLNDRSLGRRKAGRRRGYVARFKTRYQPGELTAIGYRGGVPVSRSTLRSAAGPLQLQMSADRGTVAADADQLAFVELSIADADGIVEMLADDQVELEISGPAELIGFGTATPATEESFTDNTHTTYRGRALAVLRPTGSAGDIHLVARSARHGRAETPLSAVLIHC